MMQIFFWLKKINRILRWTGFRLTIGLDDEFMKDTSNPPKTQIGLVWYGWSFVRELEKDLK